METHGGTPGSSSGSTGERGERRMAPLWQDSDPLQAFRLRHPGYWGALGPGWHILASAVWGDYGGCPAYSKRRTLWGEAPFLGLQGLFTFLSL